jgi:hypothetical protein
MILRSRHNACRAMLIAAAALLATPAGAAIFRCTAADGSVSYQEMECGAAEKSRVMDLPAQYPSADPTERQRLFEREAALDRRLEAQRERDSREAVARSMQPPEQPIPASAEDEGYPLYWGGWGAPLFQRPHPAPHRPKVTPHNMRISMPASRG